MDEIGPQKVVQTATNYSVHKVPIFVIKEI